MDFWKDRWSEREEYEEQELICRRRERMQNERGREKCEEKSRGDDSWRIVSRIVDDRRIGMKNGDWKIEGEE